MHTRTHTREGQKFTGSNPELLGAGVLPWAQGGGGLGMLPRIAADTERLLCARPSACRAPCAVSLNPGETGMASPESERKAAGAER